MTHHSKRQLLILRLFSFVQICSAICYSLQAPFYPLYGGQKGVRPMFYGLVFSIYEICIFIFSFTYKMLISKTSLRPINYLGILITGVSYIIYSLLSCLSRETYFILFSLAIRLVEASGFAAFYVSMNNIIRICFRYDDSIILILNHVSIGVGITCGPLLGGILYEIKGFMLVFMFTGSVLVISAVLVCLYLPNVTDEFDITKNCCNIFPFLKHPTIFLGSSSAFGANFSTGYLQASLVSNLHQANLRPIIIGLLFSINAAAYSFSYAMWNFVTLKWIPHQIVWLMGILLIYMGFLLIGPAPYIPMDSSMVPSMIGLLFHGAGVGAEITASMVALKREIIEMDYPDDAVTTWIVDDIVASSLILGSFAGTAVCGLLYEVIGVRWLSQVVIGLQILLFSLTISHKYIFKKRIIQSRQENASASTETVELQSENKKLLSYKTFKSLKILKALKPKTKKSNRVTNS